MLTYNGTTGVYTGAASTTNANGTVHPGEWIQIRLPSAISLEAFTIYHRLDATLFAKRSPRNFILFGSNDGTTWSLLYSEINSLAVWNTDRRFSSIWNRSAFSYFRLSIQRVGNFESSTDQNSIQISLDLFGSATGSDSLAFIASSVEYPGAVRMESFKYPGYYLRQLNSSVQFRKEFANDGGFKNDSSFYMTSGLGGNTMSLT